MFDLKGRVVVVTGASSGLGKQMATGFAERGANLVLLARRIERLEELKKELEQKGVEVLPIKCDVTSTEDVENAGSYILSNMIVPGIRDGFFSVLRGILDYWSGGVGGPKFTTSSGIRTQRYSYNQLYNRRNAAPPESSSTPAQRYAYDDIVVPTIAEAEEVIAALKDIIRVYQVARVADLFDLVGVTGSYTDNNYGWPNLDRAGYQRVSGGYLLTFPKAMPIDE